LNTANIKFSTLFLKICIYSYTLGFLRKPYRSHIPVTTSPLNASSLTTPHLPQCLSALKRFFEYLLSIPSPSYHSFTTVEWGQVVNAIVVMSRLTFLMAEERGWGPDKTREEVPLGLYLECLGWRFGSLSVSFLDSLSLMLKWEVE
jgi:hypothetical protein